MYEHISGAPDELHLVKRMPTQMKTWHKQPHYILQTCVTGSIVFMLCGSANAQESTRTTIRTLVPVLGLELGTKMDPERGADRPGWLVRWGLEASHAWRSGFTVETSYASIINATDGKGRTMALRGGYTYKLRERKGSESTRSTHVIPFAGYRHVNLPEGYHDGYNHAHLSHNAHLGVGYSIQWSARRHVLVRFNAGADVALSRRFIPHGSFMATEQDKLRRVSFFHIALGMAFYDVWSRKNKE